jgi:hypothetical protein
VRCIHLYLALDEFVGRGRLRPVRNKHFALKVFGSDHWEKRALGHTTGRLPIWEPRWSQPALSAVLSKNHDPHVKQRDNRQELEKLFANHAGLMFLRQNAEWGSLPTFGYGITEKQ